jgi:hypothetical protein
MKETYESELKKWYQDYLKAEEELLKKYPLNDNLSNNHPINRLQKEYWQKKMKILKKYNKEDTKNNFL